MALLQKAYLGATPLFRNVDWFEDGAAILRDVSNTAAVTGSATPHTKGSWSQLIASTSADTSLLVVLVTLVAANGTNTATLLDIGTGASGSETAVASNIAVGNAAAATGVFGTFFAFPCKIPSGTRLSARIQSVVASKNSNVQLFTISAGDYATTPTTVDAIGADTANSKGTSMSGSSGTWTEIIASTTQAYRAVAFVASAHSNDTAQINVNFDIGTGSSGSETIIGSARNVYTSTEISATLAPATCLFGANLPAGTRLAVRHNIASNPDRYGVTLIGIP